MQKQKALDLCWKHRNTISRDGTDIGVSKLPPFKLDLSDNTPIYQKPRHFPPPVTEEIEKQCLDLYRLDLIEESNSPWNSPIVPVRKPDGTLRICIDYRKVNDKTIKNRFPMKLISDCVYNMHGMQYFCKMDLVKGYYQMPIEPDSRPITAFSTSSKHYQFKALSFGLANAPAAFQKAMNVELKDHPKENVTNFMDDIVVMNKTFEENIDRLDKVLETLGKCKVKVNAKKCQWFHNEIEFLGHKITKDGIKKSEEYVGKIRNFPKPVTVQNLKAFLGLIQFQRKFIKNCAELTKPLDLWTSQHKKRKIIWSENMNKSFETLKEKAAEDLTLAYPDYSSKANKLEVYTDASGTGMGGALIQKQYMVKKLIE